MTSEQDIKKYMKIKLQTKNFTKIINLIRKTLLLNLIYANYLLTSRPLTILSM